jgi:hypothetical protein
VILYAETSAILAWLLNEDMSTRVEPYLRLAQSVVCSSLSLLEAERAIIRWTTLGALDEDRALKVRRTLHDTVGHWTVLHVTLGAFSRAGQPFPVEPIRSLDALHIAVLLDVRPTLPEISLLSLDHRVRDNAAALGFEVVP